MKILYLLVALILTISITSFSQDGMDKMMRQRNKIHQLEKIKLIDELNLDEETSVKFFARRNEMQKEVEKNLKKVFKQRIKIPRLFKNNYLRIFLRQEK